MREGGARNRFRPMANQESANPDSLTPLLKFGGMPGRTVFTVLEQTAAKYGEAPALHQPSGTKGKQQYRSYSWNEWLSSSREIALGLRSLGLKKGDIAAILSETRAEFYIVDLGIIGSGGVSAALYTAYPMPQLARNIIANKPPFLFVEDPVGLKDLERALGELGASLPEHVILITGEREGVLSLDRLRESGRKLEAEQPGSFAKISEEISPEDPAILYLTSGATGEPKAGLTSHRAILANIDAAPVVLPIGPEDSMIAFLPSAHIAQRIVVEMVPMLMGTPVWFSDGLSKLANELKTIRPTIFLAPPRVWEKMYANIQTEMRKRPALLRKAFYGALGLSLEAANRRRQGKPLPSWMSAAVAAADRFMFSKVREKLGGRIRIAASGAAPLGKDLAEFFVAIGMPLIEGYGLTEAGILAFNPYERPKPGSVGKALPRIQFRLAEDGELQVKSPCLFNGYYNDEAATRSVMTEDGWFATGDIAEIDDEGYLFITGRKKELIVSSNGKKIYPSRIENLFKMEPVISQVLLIGDKRPYVTALLTLNFAQLKSLPELAEIGGKAEELVESEPVLQTVQGAVSRVNKHLADFERIRRFRVLDREFSIEHGELTPTMKIRRNRVLENHRDLVSSLYLGKEET